MEQQFLLVLLYTVMQVVPYTRTPGWDNDWGLKPSPHFSFQAVCLDTGKHSPGDRVAFFPIHTEIQYGLAAVPFSLQRDIRILNSIKLLSGLIVKDRNYRSLCFTSLLAVICVNHWFKFFLLAVFSAWNAFPSDSHMASFSDHPEVFA